jgi:hypothetical protein
MLRDTKKEWIRDSYAVRMGNFGQTPAYRVRARSRIELHPFPLDEPLTLGVEPEKSSQTHALLSPTEPRLIVKKYATSDEERKLISAGTHALYFFGRIEYEDVFKKARWTTFCYFMDNERINMERWGHYPVGNDADRGKNKPLF